MSTQRIHSPSGEPFDVPGHKDVSELLLYKGWTRAKPDPKAIPLVQTVARAPLDAELDAIWPRHPEPSKTEQAELEAAEDAHDAALLAEAEAHDESAQADTEAPADDLEEAVEDEPLPRRRRRPVQAATPA